MSAKDGKGDPQDTAPEPRAEELFPPTPAERESLQRELVIALVALGDLEEEIADAREQQKAELTEAKKRIRVLVNQLNPRTQR